MVSRDELVVEWGRTLSHRERARIEAAIWADMPVAERRERASLPHKGMGNVLSRLLHTSIGGIEARCFLWLAGQAADPLWEELEAERITLTRCASLLKRARSRFPGGKPSPTAVRMVVVQLLEERRKGIKEAEERTARPIAPSSKPSADVALDSPSAVWGSVRGVLGVYLAQRMAELEEEEAQRLMDDFAREFKELVKAWGERIRSARACAGRTNGLRMRVARARMLKACHVLSLNPPKVGTLANLKLARKKQRALVRLLHPDVHGGSEATREAFENVIAAYKILEAYNEGLAHGLIKQAIQIEETDNGTTQ